MGTIVSPVNGSDVYKGSVVPIIYRSDTVDFQSAGSGNIAVIRYLLDGNDQTGFVAISQSGAAPQTQAAQNITFPATGATAQIDVEGWSVGGQRNDTATANYNLVDLPSVVCDPATLITENGAQLNGTITGTLIAGGSARFVWGTTTPNTNEPTTYTAGAVLVALAGLLPGTTYVYRLEILDDQGNVVATGAQCAFTTNTAVVQAGAQNAQLVKLCTITGITPMYDCATNIPIFLVSVTASDGDVIPADSTEFPASAGAGIFSTIGYYRSYYADTLGNYIDPQPTACLPSNIGAPSIATILVCGVVGGVSKMLIRREMVDSAGTETVTFVDTDGVEVTPTSWTPGQCDNHLTSTIERLVGAGSITIPANARSITVAVNAGNPTVQIGSGAAIALVKNLAFTWGTNDRNEDLTDAFVFTGLAGDDFYVTTSRL